MIDKPESGQTGHLSSTHLHHPNDPAGRFLKRPFCAPEICCPAAACRFLTHVFRAGRFARMKTASDNIDQEKGLSRYFQKPTANG